MLAATLSDSFLSVPSAPSAVKSTTGNQGPGGTGPYPIPRPPSHPKLPGTRRPSPYPQHQLLRGWRRPVSKPPAPSQPKTSWDETSQPQSTPSITSGFETSRLHTSHALATQNFLGRDVPAPIQTLDDFGGGDGTSPPGTIQSAATAVHSKRTGWIRAPGRIPNGTKGTVRPANRDSGAFPGMSGRPPGAPGNVPR